MPREAAVTYCPGCLYADKALERRNCGSQRCPPYAKATLTKIGRLVAARDAEKAAFNAAMEAGRQRRAAKRQAERTKTALEQIRNAKR